VFRRVAADESVDVAATTLLASTLDASMAFTASLTRFPICDVGGLITVIVWDSEL
jgi:hypothetical protein